MKLFPGFKIVYAILGLLALVISIPSTAQAGEEIYCTDFNNAPEQRIRACTELMKHPKRYLKSELAQFYLSRAVAYGGGKVKKALKDINIAIALDPDNIGALYEKADVIYQTPGLKYKDAIRERIKIYTRIIKLKKKIDTSKYPFLRLDDYYRSRMLSYIELGDYRKAIDDNDKLLKIASNSATHYCDRAAIFSEQKKYEKAITNYNKCEKLSTDIYLTSSYLGKQPRSSYAYWKSWTLTQMGKLDLALSEISKAIAIKNTNWNYYTFRAKLYSQKKEYRLSMKDLQRVVEKKNDTEAYYIIGWNLENLKKLDQAILAYNKAIELAPKNTNALFRRGLILLFSKKKAREAISDFNQVVRLAPNYSPAYQYRGQAHLEEKALDSAINDFTKVTKLAPKLADGYIWRADAYSKKGEHTKALKDALSALQLAPKNAGVNNAVAWIYYKAGAAKKGLPFVKKSLKLNPKSYEAWDTLGSIQEARGNTKAAIEAYKKAMALDPKHQVSKEHLMRLGVINKKW